MKSVSQKHDALTSNAGRDDERGESMKWVIRIWRATRQKGEKKVEIAVAVVVKERGR